MRIKRLDTDTATDRPTALLLPGAGYTAQAPLLYWSTSVLLSLGWRVFAAEWEEGDREYATPFQMIDHAFELATAEACNEAPGGVDLVVAKSLGTFALPRCIDEGIAGVWLTPLLNKADISAALVAADRRHLAIGGTNDRHWLPAAAKGTEAEMVSVEDADHSLLLDDWRESMRVHSDVTGMIAEHLRGL